MREAIIKSSFNIVQIALAEPSQLSISAKPLFPLQKEHFNH